MYVYLNVYVCFGAHLKKYEQRYTNLILFYYSTHIHTSRCDDELITVRVLRNIQTNNAWHFNLELSTKMIHRKIKLN